MNLIYNTFQILILFSFNRFKVYILLFLYNIYEYK